MYKSSWPIISADIDAPIRTPSLLPLFFSKQQRYVYVQQLSRIHTLTLKTEAECTFETSTTLSPHNHVCNNSKIKLSLQSSKTIDYIGLKYGHSSSNWKILGTSNVTAYADNNYKESVRWFPMIMACHLLNFCLQVIGIITVNTFKNI